MDTNKIIAILKNSQLTVEQMENRYKLYNPSNLQEIKPEIVVVPVGEIDRTEEAEAEVITTEQEEEETSGEEVGVVVIVADKLLIENKEAIITTKILTITQIIISDPYS